MFLRVGHLFKAISTMLAAGMLVAASLPAVGGNTDTQASSGRVPKPVIERARSEKCVADPAFMRRNHMELLRHQRDETVHGGVRTAKYSLKECIACHASQTSGSVAAASTNFCQSCHSFAAVKIDCFECHATKPPSTSAHPPLPHVRPGDSSLNVQRSQLSVPQQLKP